MDRPHGELKAIGAQIVTPPSLYPAAGTATSIDAEAMETATKNSRPELTILSCADAVAAVVVGSATCLSFGLVEGDANARVNGSSAALDAPRWTHRRQVGRKEGATLPFVPQAGERHGFCAFAGGTTRKVPRHGHRGVQVREKARSRHESERGNPYDPAKVAAGARRVAEVNCASCHGAGFAGADAVPRLAGQTAGYLISQLEAFAAGRRPHPSIEVSFEKLGDVESIAQYFSATK